MREETLSSVFPVSPSRLFSALFADPAVQQRFHETLQHTDVRVSQWRKIDNSATDGRQCLVTYSTAQHFLISEKTNADGVKVREFQTYELTQEAIVVSSRIYLEGINAAICTINRTIKNVSSAVNSVEPVGEQCEVGIDVSAEYRGLLRKGAIETILCDDLVHMMEEWAVFSRALLTSDLNEDATSSPSPERALLRTSRTEEVTREDMPALLRALTGQMHEIHAIHDNNSAILRQCKQNIHILQGAPGVAGTSEQAFLRDVDAKLTAYMDRLEILALRQKEAEALSRKKEAIMRVRCDEAERRLRVILKRLRYPIPLASWRHFISVVTFLVIWPIIVRFIWIFIGRPGFHRLLRALDMLFRTPELPS